jgi:hypothetical protein
MPAEIKELIIGFDPSSALFFEKESVIERD